MDCMFDIGSSPRDDGRFGSLADYWTNSSLMAAFEQKAVIQITLKSAKSKVRFQTLY